MPPDSNFVQLLQFYTATHLNLAYLANVKMDPSQFSRNGDRNSLPQEEEESALTSPSFESQKLR